MNKLLRPPKFIIVLGTSYSGSGAVFDYLKGRADLSDPLMGDEYLLPHAPGGLMDFESALGKSFSPAGVDSAAFRFLELAKKLDRSPKLWSYGRGYSELVGSFYSCVQEFVGELTVAKMPMRLHWRESDQTSFKRLQRKVLSRVRLMERAETTFLTGNVESFLENSRFMHARIFSSSGDGRPVLLNQAGSGWNPVESTKYFAHRKVILVTRDPRDQFAELKLYKNASNVDEYINWFRELEGRVNGLDDTVLTRCSFEDFVLSHHQKVNELCRFLGVSQEVTSKYKSEESLKNIGMYRSVLTKNEVLKIEENLPYYPA